MGGTAAIPAVLTSRGADPAEVLDEAGVSPDLFDDPDNVISLVALDRLLQHCVAVTGCRHFGLLVGQRGGLHSLGLVGLVVRYSPDVATALSKLGSYLHLHNRGAISTVTTGGGKAMITYDFHQPNLRAIDQLGSGALASMHCVLRTLCGRDWRPIEVHFAHHEPEDVRPFRQFFRAPLQFDAAQNAIVFSHHWLKRPLPEVDPELDRLLRRHIDALEAQDGDDLPDQVRAVLRTVLLTDDAGIQQVAALFSMHTRTLSRRLHSFGTSFKALADEGRSEFARKMLQNTALDVFQIASSLGYADASAFTRAFRRWTDSTPAAWRKKKQAKRAGIPGDAV